MFASNDSPGTSATSATIQHVVNGDTVYVLLEGTGTKVRLLNADAAETAPKNQPGQCFGQVTSQFLARKLPAESKVRLTFDVKRHGRTLAALTRKGQLINESLALSRHSKAMKVEPNLKCYDQLGPAQRQAQQNKAGIFNPVTGCR